MKEDKILDAVFRNEQMESVARYLSRGRRLQSLDEATLRQLWIDELRQIFREGSGASVTSEEISAELSLRGIKRVELPPDLKAAMEIDAAKTKRAIELFPEFGRGLLNEIDAFKRTLAKPKN
jgi:hypothetical protein